MKHLFLFAIYIFSVGLTPSVVRAGATVIDTTAYDAFVKSIQATGTTYDASQVAAAKTAQENQAKMTLISTLLQSCPYFHKQAAQPMPGPDKKIKKTARTVTDAAFEAREEEGYVYEKDLDQNLTKTIGQDAKEKFAEGCDHFMNAEGKMGPWGSWALQLIKDKPKSFGDNIPDDITKWCPNYPKMSKGQRDLFWVWGMMSMASSESSCKPTNDNPNAPNGTAIGLFQLEPRVCPKANDLHNPNQNITCAVDLLASELQNRDNLMTPTSKGQEGTYWGPLRNDDKNLGRGGDIKGAQKTRALMREYRYCKGDLTVAPSSPKTKAGSDRAADVNADSSSADSSANTTTTDTTTTDTTTTDKTKTDAKKATKKKTKPIPAGTWI